MRPGALGKYPLTLCCVKCQTTRQLTGNMVHLTLTLLNISALKAQHWVTELFVNVGGREYGVIPHVPLCCGIWSFLCSVHMVSTWSQQSHLTKLFSVLLRSLILCQLFALFFFSGFPLWVLQFYISSCVIVAAALSLSFGPLYRPINGRVCSGAKWLWLAWSDNSRSIFSVTSVRRMYSSLPCWMCAVCVCVGVCLLSNNIMPEESFRH